MRPAIAARPTIVAITRTTLIATSQKGATPAAMRTGIDFKLTVQDANKKPIEMSLPLLGFGIAYDKTK